MSNSSEWKCLSCESQGNFSNFSVSGWCPNCNGKSLEVKISIHYNCFECPTCHKVKDIVYHNISSQENEIRKNKAKENWLKSGESCIC